MAITVAKAISEFEVANLLEPEVSSWFFTTFGSLTPPQVYAIRSIQNHENTLIAAPTGSGKTLAVFLSIINELLSMGKRGLLEDAVYAIYVSPLRSLNNDIEKNLNSTLKGIQRAAKIRGLDKGLPEIRVAVRTGDTPSSERAKMLRKPPHILITTPESLAIILCAPKFREKLRSVKWVIVDEIHELCSSKRGVHLTLSLERLQELCTENFTRIGLSATIHPLEEVAKFLVGFENGALRDCVIADTRFVKPTKLTVDLPVADLVHTSANYVTSRMYKVIKNLVRRHKTTLIFTNTRSGTERVVYHLSKLNVVDADELAAHHSSLSREIRKEVEDKLKEGVMRAVVTSTSLELGIDIGSIDLVVQIGSPKSISRCLQRIGRSGHTLNKVSEGVLIPLERDDLVEDAVLAAEASKGRLDRVYIPKAPLDVLAQHIVGMAIEKKWHIDEAYKVLTRSYCYRDLTLDQMKRLLKYLSGGYKSLENFRVYGKIWYDEDEGTFGRRGALLRVIYATNIGTIPDEVAIKVYTVEGRWVGSIEEEFLERLTKGDIFILGGRLYEYRYSKGAKAYVKPIKEGKPTVPTWFSEMLPLSFDLGEAIGRFRGEMFRKLKERVAKNEIINWVMQDYKCTLNAAKAILGYMKAEYDFLTTLGITEMPSNKNLLVEDYLDNEGRQNIIFNATFGRRVNDALSRAYAHILALNLKANIMLTVSDSGFMLTLPRGKRVDPHWLVKQVGKEKLRSLLISSIRNTELIRRRFRHCATRSLMVLRNYKGHEITVAKQQTNSQILFKLCDELEGFPVVEEAYREVLEDVMDVKTAEEVLGEIYLGERRYIIAPSSDLPSPFTHDLILLGYSDVVLMEDKKALLEALYDSVLRRIKEKRLEGRARR
ncbi:MAG: ATP-dependent helicase [Nitrososphaerales archaeon]